MPREYLQYLEDILECIRRIENFTSNLSLEDFKKDIKTQDAVLRNLQVIGEAVKAIPEEIRIENPDIEWKKIAGLRDIITHLYFGLDNAIIWDVIRNKLDPLKAGILKILKSIEN
jgi:uncharacterized protein with HEPN domain